MKGKKKFSKIEADIIIELIGQKLQSDSAKQKTIRAKIRRMGFYATDFGLGGGYNQSDFINNVIIEDDGISMQETVEQIKVKTIQKRFRKTTDESYVIDLCDELLGITASRQHRFKFLKGDAGTKLPVDAYYKPLNLVIEYREKQHSEEVKFFDNKKTVSGVSRGKQRMIYDQRRRDVLPENGITLIELDYSEFAHTSSKRLTRDRKNDLSIIRERLLNYIKN